MTGPVALVDGFRPCALIPTYDNPRTIRAVVESVRRFVPDVVVIDDGSADAGRSAVGALGTDGLAHVHHREKNGGKGAAVKTGFRVAFELGFTHALQVDADGQHDLEDAPKLLSAAQGDPEALVLGAPIYDETAPRGRLVGRRITQWWTNRETGGPVIDDPMCGFRVYPLARAVDVRVPANRMDFDIEVAVRMVWAGARVINIPTRVKYLPAEAGGVSHFRMFEDNVRISWMHARLYNIALWRRVFSPSTMAAPEPIAPRGSEWLERPERGSAFALKMLIFTMRLLGRGGVRIALAVVAFYYALFARAANRASREYLARLYPKVTFWMVVRHIRTFGEASFDRMLFAAGRTDEFDIERTGKENLAELARTKRGAILLGAHLGSFEAMRAMARHEDIKINVLVHFKNARKINAMLKAIAPDFQARIIEIDPAAPHYVLTVQERIEAGELVAVLGDRIGLNERTAEANFLGGRAKFPVGPYTLAAVLKCPIYLTFGLYHRPKLYSLYCEPFAEKVELPRKTRDAALQELVQRYADRLEFYVRRAPYCWFNFFDFWASANHQKR